MSNSAFYFNIIIIITIVVLGAVMHSLGSTEASPHCHQIEKQALLSFKHDLKDPTGRLSSWVAGESCCNWHGVVCDNLTGHVMELQLRGYLSSDGGEDSLLGGRINNSLLDLKHLRYLDLSQNDFGGIQIPFLIGSIRSLTYLNLSVGGFGGEIPPHIGNLSNLLYLGIAGSSSFTTLDSYGLHTKSFLWLSGLSMLRYLDLSCVLFPETSSALQGIDALPHLEELYLRGTGQTFDPDPITWFPSANSSNLVILDLSHHSFDSLPGGLENLTSLKYLDLTYCLTNSTFPSWLYKFSQLEQLLLGGNFFRGTIADDIGNLTLLNHLDLSGNVIGGKIPRSLGQLQNLEQLDLSRNTISGQIPDSLGSLNSLVELMLYFNQLNGTLPPSLGQLYRLEHIDLMENSISGMIPDSLRSLNSLISLDFSSNQLSGTIPDQTFVHMHHLKRLYFSNNSISGPIPDSIGSLKSLEYFDLSANQLNGTLPRTIGELHLLSFLSLKDNSISGVIPDSMGSLASLSHLDLSSNKLSGLLPSSLGQLIQLDTLDISFNSLEGVLSSAFFANLTRLSSLSGSGNRIRMEVGSDWIPPFHLDVAHLSMSSWYLGPKFPKWLSSLERLSELDISLAGIDDIVPSWFWNMTSQIATLNMSHNHLHGQILSSSYHIFDLSNNSFSGSMSSLLCDQDYFETVYLQILHLGDNKLFGEIPDCWSNWSSIVTIKLHNNNLTGNLPKSLGSLPLLQFLHLRNNSLSGILPSLQNCVYLQVVDIAENKLGGRVPKWIGQTLSGIRILNLRSNNFRGYIPNEFCALSSLIVLDLAHNNLSGGIPDCLANLSAMAKPSMSYFSYIFVPGGGYIGTSYSDESEILVIKELVLEYTNNLRFMTLIDLSNNSLSGPIPEGITSLVALMSLNLSGNSLTEKIPNNMGNMSLLESLDLSLNKLSGEIPQSIADMTFLSFLNLSFNDLTGRIPTSTQLQSFNASSYIGNRLCGPPVSTNCGPKGLDPKEQHGDSQHHGVEHEEFYVSMSVGYVVGLGAVIAPLLYSTNWRDYFFRWLQNKWDKLWVWTLLFFRT